MKKFLLTAIFTLALCIPQPAKAQQVCQSVFYYTTSVDGVFYDTVASGTVCVDLSLVLAGITAAFSLF